MAAVGSIIWQDARDLLADMTAEALGWDDTQVTWNNEAGQVNNNIARWSMVSSQHYADPTDTVDPDTLVASQNTVTNATIQLLIEATDPNLAIDSLDAVKRYITLQSTLQGLQLGGVSVMREPGASRNTPFMDGYSNWISAGSFDLQISFNTLILDGVPVCKATQVQMNGLLDEEIPIAIDQSEG